MPTDTLIPEAVAATLYRGLPGATDDERGRAVEVLRRYGEQQRLAGQPLWPEDEAKKAEEGARVLRFYTDPKHGLSDEANAEIDRAAFGSTKPEETKAQGFNRQYLAHAFGVDPSVLQGVNHSAFRRKFAASRWNLPDVTETDFFNRIKAETELSMQASQHAVASALQQLPAEHAFNTWRLENEKTSGFDATRADEYRKNYRRSFDAVMTDVARLSPVANNVFSILSSATSEADLRAAIPLVEKLDDKDAGIVMAMLDIKGKSFTPEDKGTWLKSGEAIHRSIRDAWKGAASGFDLIDLSHARSRIERGTALVTPEATWSGTGDAIVNHLVGDSAPAQSMPMRPLTPEEKTLALEAIDKRIKDGRQLRRLQTIADTIVDPVKSKNWFAEKFYYSALPSAGIMMNALIPGGFGLIANAAGYTTAEHDRLLDAGAPPDKALDSARLVGSLQAAGDALEASMLVGRVPLLKRVLKNPVRTVPGELGAFLAGSTINTAAETVIELWQDHVAPALVQEITKVGGDVEWLGKNGVIQKAIAAAPETAGAMVLLGMIGSGAAVHSDVKNARQLLQSTPLLQGYGLTDAQASEVRIQALKGDMSAASALFRQYAAPAIKGGATLDTAHAAASAAMAATEARRHKVALGELDSYSVNAPEIEMTETGWKIRFPDKTESAEFKSYEDAADAKWQHTQEVELFRPAEITRRILSESDKAGLRPGDIVEDVFNFVPLRVERAVEKGLMSEEGAKLREQQAQALVNGETVDVEHGKAAALIDASSEHASDSLSGRYVLGLNKVTYADKVRRITRSFFVAPNERAGGIDNPLTTVEESSETAAKDLIANGQRQWLISALREYEGVYGDTLLRTKDDAALKDSDLVEAFSHLATAVFVGRTMKGNAGKFAGMQSNQMREQIRGLFNLRIGSALDGIAELYQAAFRRAAAIQKARGQAEAGGKFFDLERMISQSLGLSEQDDHERGVEEEARKLATDVGTLDSTASSATFRHDNADARSQGQAARAGSDLQQQGGTLGDASKAGELQDARGVRGSVSGIQSPGRAASEIRPLVGLPSKIDVPGRGETTFGPFETARKVASAYMEKAGLPYNPPTTYAKVDKERAKRIAAEYDAMEDNIDDPATKASYEAMARETLAQWEAIRPTGLVVEPIPKGTDPYAESPRLAILDVIENNHLWFFPTDNGYGTEGLKDEDKNPLLAFTGETIGGLKMRVNDVFRIVHDYFGHIKEGVGFRADGEENAWRSHVAMYSPEARGAMTSETRGQNSWVNFGPYGDANRSASSENTHYADQKLGLLPEWAQTEGAGDPETTASIAKLGSKKERSAANYIRQKLFDEDALTSDVQDALSSLPPSKYDIIEIESALWKVGEKRDWKEILRDEGDANHDFEGADEKDLFAWAKQHHGLTDNIHEAGYILPDGKLLDFSGKRQGGSAGQRAEDHRQIQFPNRPGEGYDAMRKFMEAGAVRVSVAHQGTQPAAVQLLKAPTSAQLSRIREAAEAGGGGLLVDVEDGGRHGAIDTENIAKGIGLIRRFYAGEDIKPGVTFSTARITPAQDAAYREALKGDRGGDLLERGVDARLSEYPAGFFQSRVETPFKAGKGGLVSTKYGDKFVGLSKSGVYYIEDANGHPITEKGISRSQGISGPNYNRNNPRPISWNGYEDIKSAVEDIVSKYEKTQAQHDPSGTSQDRQALAERDRLWLARNPESAKKLQAMVDERAKEAGYKILFHGPSDPSVRSVSDIRPDLMGWFTDSEKEAATYSNGGPPLRAAVKIENPVFSDHDPDGEFRQQWRKDFPQLENLGHDGIYNKQADAWIPFRPSQIKSADPITRNDKGEIIPLSQRFNQSKAQFTHSVAKLAPGDITQRVQNIFNPFQRNPDLRRALGLEMQRRAIRVARQWESAANTPAPKLDEHDLEIAAGAGDKVAAKRLDDLNALQAKHELETGGAIQDGASRAELKALREKHRRELAKQQEGWKDSDAKAAGKGTMMAALRTLDAIASALPPEIGHKVNITKVASLETDEARLKEIERKGAQINDLVETYLRKDITQQLADLLKKAQPKGDPGEKLKGKIGDEGHRFFVHVHDAIAMSADEARDEMDKLELVMLDPNAKPHAQDNALERWSVMQIFGGFESMNAAEMDGALRAAQDVYDKGRKKWLAMLEARKAERDAFRAEAMNELGGKAEWTDAQITTADEKERGQREKVRDWFNRHFSFQQLLADIFGNGATLKRYERRTRAQTAAKTDAMRQRIADFRDAMLRVFKTTSWREAQGKLAELQNLNRSAPVTFYTETALNRVEVPTDVLRWVLDGTRSKNDFDVTKNLSANDLAELGRALALNDAAPANQQKGTISFEHVIDGKPLAKGAISQLEGVHFTMLWRQEQYRKAMTKNGVTVDTINDIEQWLTPEAKAIRSWLADQYDDGYQSLNEVFKRMFGVDLPRVSNYAPGYFEVSGKTTDIDPFGSGVDGAGFAAGFLKRRKDHLARPVQIDALQAYWQHVMQTEHWKAFAELTSEMRSVLGDKEINRTVAARSSAGMAQDLNWWIDTIEKGGVRDAQGNAFVAKIMRAMTRVALAYKAGVLLKQLPAAIQSLADIPADAWARSAARVNSGKGAMSVTEAYNLPVIKRRIESGYSPEMRAGMRGPLAKPGLTDDVLEWGMTRIGYVDAAFTSYGAAVVFDHHFTEAKAAGMSDPDARALAMTMMEETIGRTAQPGELMDRSRIELEAQGIGKLLFMFQSANRQAWSIVYAAAKGAASGKKSKAELGRVALTYFVLVPAISQTATGLMRYLFTDDDLEEAFDWKDYATAMALGPSSGIMFLGAAIQAAAEMLGKGHIGKDANPLVKSFVDLGRAGKHFFDDTADNFTARDFGEAATGIGLLLSGFVNAPTEAAGVTWNVLKQILGVGKNLVEEKKSK